MKRQFALRGCGLLVIGALTGCLTDLSDSRPPGPEDVTFAQELNINLSSMSRTQFGVYFLDEEEGSGTLAEVYSSVTLHYTGWLHDGHQFDSSLDREPFTFVIALDSVIPGWHEGILGMREGGKRLLVIPHEMAYGAQGAFDSNAGVYVIPPFANLVFRVELLEVDKEEDVPDA